MNSLRVFNETIYNEYLKISNIDTLASPNLVSSKRFLNEVNPHPIMYIGQETYGWVNYNNENPNLDTIENAYDDFFFRLGTSKTHYWRFVKNILDTNYYDLHKDIVWTNTILAGKKHDKGNPEVTKKLEDISIKNLLFLYEYFEPRCIISVTGNNNPYYSITKSFLEKINSKLIDTYPTRDKPLLIDDKNNFCWTYHPMRLIYDRNFNSSVEDIKALIKSTK